jgi:hypothetical protein
MLLAFAAIPLIVTGELLLSTKSFKAGVKIKPTSFLTWPRFICAHAHIDTKSLLVKILRVYN